MNLDGQFSIEPLALHLISYLVLSRVIFVTDTGCSCISTITLFSAVSITLVTVDIGWGCFGKNFLALVTVRSCDQLRIGLGFKTWLIGL